MLELPRFKRKKGKINEFEFLFEVYPKPIYLVDWDLNIILVNKAFKDCFDFEPAHLNDILGTLRPFEQSYDVKDHHLLALKGQQQKYKTRNIARITSLLYMDNQLIPYTTDHGKDMVIGIMQDVTALKQQTEDLVMLRKSLSVTESLLRMGLWTYDVEGDWADWNDCMYEIAGLKKGTQINYAKCLEIVHPEDRGFFTASFQRSIDEGVPWKMQYRVVTESGETLLVNQYADGVLNEEGKVGYLTGALFVEGKASEGTETTVNLHERFYQHLDACVWAKNTVSGEMVFCSQGVFELTGYQPEEFVSGDRIWTDVIHPKDLPAYMRQQKNDTPNGWTHEYRIIHQNGEVKWVNDKTILTKDEEGNIVRTDGILVDISNKKRYEHKIEFLQTHDCLTNMLNRKMFNTMLGRHLESSPDEFALVTIDVDGFKRVNNALGHVIGDELLIHMASRITALLGKEDFAARTSGNEFSIVFKNVRGDRAIQEIADQLACKLNKPYYIGGYELHMTASIGIAVYPRDGRHVQLLLKRSVAAVLRAKQLGDGQYLAFDPAMNIESYKTYELERDLRKAIDESELCLFYQPIVDPVTSKMLRAEALVRWRHKEWKLVSPGEFIPIAEENGMIHDLTDWTFHALCSQLKNWQAAGLTVVPVSINLSPKRLLKDDWVDMILKTISDYDVDPSLIEIEITETVLIQNAAKFEDNMDRLRRLGIKVSLDDFGTGYSSLTYLSKLKVDTLKIDRSFISEDSTSKNSEIAKTVIHLAESLDMQVVAEGVETLEQLQFLRQHGCPQVQGYLYSKPKPAAEFEALLKKPHIEPIRPSGMPDVERRKEKRSEFSYPLQSSMTITKINDKSIRVGKTEVQIENMGSGGLRLLTNLQLPVSSDFLLELDLAIGGLQLTMNGIVVWKEEASEGNLRYGVEFSPETSTSEHLEQLLSHLKT